MLLTRVAELQQRVAADAARYAGAAPFPHIVIDEFLEAATLAKAMAEFPAPESRDDWRRGDHGRPVEEQTSRHKTLWQSRPFER